MIEIFEGMGVFKIDIDSDLRNDPFCRNPIELVERANNLCEIIIKFKDHNMNGTETTVKFAIYEDQLEIIEEVIKNYRRKKIR